MERNEWASELAGLCGVYCQHGGVCTLDRDHEGQHDSKYCQWSDAESISKADADELIRRKAGPGLGDFLGIFT